MRFLADLALFVEVANTGSFRRAAAALGMPASTLSRRISALEQELGFQLIHRSSRTFALTDAGKTCYEQSKTLVTEAKRIQENVAGIARQASGHIRVGVPFDLAQTIFLPLFAQYMLDNPFTSIEVLSISGHTNLLAESLDMAIWVGHQLRLPDSSFWSRRITADQAEALKLICIDNRTVSAARADQVAQPMPYEFPTREPWRASVRRQARNKRGRI